MTPEQDWTVILARGASTRMGFPKGLCRLPGMTDCFLVQIATLHQEAGHSVAVATTSGLYTHYAPVLDGKVRVRWLLGPAGQGTAQTVKAAANLFAAEPRHLWLHPVDMPLVSLSVLAALREQRRRRPEAVIVPEHKGQPGHPVILPPALLATLCRQAPGGNLRTWLLAVTAPGPAQSAPLLSPSLPDESIVTDFDTSPAVPRKAAHSPANTGSEPGRKEPQ